MDNMDQLQDILDNPLEYVDDQNKHNYRVKAIRVALILIAVGIVAFITDAYTGGMMTNTWNYNPSPGKSASRDIGFGLCWLAVELLAPPYGIYRLITLKRHIKILARRDLVALNPDLRALYSQHKRIKSQARQARLNTFMNGISKVFFVGVTVCVVMAVLVIVGVIIYDIHSR